MGDLFEDLCRAACCEGQECHWTVANCGFAAEWRPAILAILRRLRVPSEGMVLAMIAAADCCQNIGGQCNPDDCLRGAIDHLIAEGERHG